MRPTTFARVAQAVGVYLASRIIIDALAAAPAADLVDSIDDTTRCDYTRLPWDECPGCAGELSLDDILDAEVDLANGFSTRLEFGPDAEPAAELLIAGDVPPEVALAALDVVDDDVEAAQRLRSWAVLVDHQGNPPEAGQLLRSAAVYIQDLEVSWGVQVDDRRAQTAELERLHERVAELEEVARQAIAAGRAAVRREAFARLLHPAGPARFVVDAGGEAVELAIDPVEVASGRELGRLLAALD